MKELPFFSSLSAVNDTNPLSYGKLHRNIIKQQCFSCSGKSAEPEISFSFSTNPLQDLSFNISLLRGKEILFFEKTFRFCQWRDQIQFCLKQLFNISLIVRGFFLQCITKLFPVSLHNMIVIGQSHQTVFTADISIRQDRFPENGQIIPVLDQLSPDGLVRYAAAFQFNIHNLVIFDLKKVKLLSKLRNLKRIKKTEFIYFFHM